MQVWRAIGALGRFMMRAGVLVLLFVAYQLWGTGLATARAQDDLQRQFEQQVADGDDAPSSSSSTAPSTESTSTTTTTQPATASLDIEPPETGGLIGRIQMPTIGADFYVVQGVDLESLKKGPGHFPQTPLPGQPGNAALAGHRTTYLAPFNRIDELQPGDEITVTTVQGTFTYVVDPHENEPGAPPEGHFIVSPTQTEILDQPPGVNRLTLMACHPKYSARQRIVVTATLQTPPAAPSPPLTPDQLDAAGVTTDASIDALAGGDSSAWPQAIVWSLVAIALWFAAWLVSRLVGRRWTSWGRWSRIPVYLVALPFFAVALFHAYENIARLLPASY